MNLGYEVDHTAIAVKNLDLAQRVYLDLGFTTLHTETVHSESVRLVFLRAGTSLLEILEPVGKGGQLGKFIEKHGEGLHHLAMRVPDIERAVLDSKSKGYICAGEIRPGALGRQVAFLHPRSTQGVLIELVEGTPFEFLSPTGG
ncbi:MAG: methylmalonyl-CoA epimerase [bacterium]|nr:methylmalonyl-CoA epimerase [bacterium]